MHHVGTARLLLAPDMLLVFRHCFFVVTVRFADVTARVVVDFTRLECHAFFRLFQQGRARPEQGRAGRTGFGTTRHLAIVDSRHALLVAHLAFLDLPEGVVKLELWNVVGTAHHAGTTTDAGILVVGDDAGQRMSAKGRHRAGRDTSGVDAMHATAFFKAISVGLCVLGFTATINEDLDDVERIAREISGQVPGLLIFIGHGWHIVDLLAF